MAHIVEAKPSAKLTREDLETLQGFFPLEDHEFHPYTKYVYITEAAITNRIEEIDPAWQLRHIETRQRVNDQTVNKDRNLEPITVITVTVEMEIKGSRRIGIGSATVGLTKNKTGEANDAEKSAATDALKRAARMFGVGRYLLSLKGVDDPAKLKTWLSKQGYVAPVAMSVTVNSDSEVEPEAGSKEWNEQLNKFNEWLCGNTHKASNSWTNIKSEGVLENVLTMKLARMILVYRRAENDFQYNSIKVDTIAENMELTDPTTKQDFFNMWNEIKAVNVRELKQKKSE